LDFSGKKAEKAKIISVVCACVRQLAAENSNQKISEKSLDTIAIDNLYKTACAKNDSRKFEEENVDEHDPQRANDEMAAVRRHVFARLLVRSNVLSDEYFWR